MIDYRTIYKETKTMRILLVEDHRSLREEMTEILEDLVQTVTCAEDGREALSLYMDAQKENRGYDLIISDIQMPHMNGVTFAKKVRELNEQQSLVILSAYTDKEYLLELINLGIARFLTKPIDYDELLNILYTQGQTINSQQSEEPASAEIDLSQGYVWNSDTRMLMYEGKHIELTKHELLLLEFFIAKEGYICSHDTIVEKFYTHNIELSERNVRNLIFKVRKKIPQECIQSVYGLGYKFRKLA